MPVWRIRPYYLKEEAAKSFVAPKVEDAVMLWAEWWDSVDGGHLAKGGDMEVIVTSKEGDGTYFVTGCMVPVYAVSKMHVAVDLESKPSLMVATVEDKGNKTMFKIIDG